MFFYFELKSVLPMCDSLFIYFVFNFCYFIKYIYCHTTVQMMDYKLSCLRKIVFYNINMATLEYNVFLPTYRMSHKINSRQKKANTC